MSADLPGSNRVSVCIHVWHGVVMGVVSIYKLRRFVHFLTCECDCVWNLSHTFSWQSVPIQNCLWKVLKAEIIGLISPCSQQTLIKLAWTDLSIATFLDDQIFVLGMFTLVQGWFSFIVEEINVCPVFQKIRRHFFKWPTKFPKFLEDIIGGFNSIVKINCELRPERLVHGSAKYCAKYVVFQSSELLKILFCPVYIVSCIWCAAQSPSLRNIFSKRWQLILNLQASRF